MNGKNTIKYLELFSGIGGFRTAVERAGKSSNVDVKCVGFSDIDSNAVKTYKANFNVGKDELEIGDITSINSDEKIKNQLPNFNILFAGFPCQPFSLMGEKEGFLDSRGTLFFQIANILSIKKPDFFILENVRGLKTHDGGKTFERILEILKEDLGYNVRTEMLNSLDFGVPQVRRRLFFIGIKNKKIFDEFSKIEFGGKRERKFKTMWHLLEREVDDKYYLSERLIKTILADGSGNYKSKSEINRIFARPLTATMHKMHRANQDNYYSDAFINGKYVSSGYVETTNIGKKRIRRITPMEAFRLQGFDDSFTKKASLAGVSDTQLYRQAGNAITVNVAEEIIKSLFRIA